MEMKFEFKKKVLDNGLTILFEKRDLPSVSIAFAVRSGGINETAEEKGISHFIEHMLYKGTPTRDARKIAEEIERNGGEMNGFTSDEVTAFHCKLPSDKAEIGLNVLLDMVKNPLFDEKELDKERRVIFEEIKMRKDNPRIYVMDRIQSLLYEAPFGEELIGTYETMSKITRDDLLKRFREVYTPDNMILIVVGDYDFDRLVEFAEKNFGKERKKEFVAEVKEKNGSVVEEREGLDQANVMFSFHSPTYMDDKSYAAEVLTALLAGGMSSRLFSEIREKRNLAYAVKGEPNVSGRFAYCSIYVGTTRENVEKVKELILEEFKKVAEGLGEEELNSVKTQLIGNYRISLDDSHGQMTNLLFSEVYGDVERYYDFDKKISEVRLEDVKELASKVVKGDYSFFALVPKK